MAPLEHVGSYFGTSGAPWEAVLALRDRHGGPWEQQDGLEVANNRICVDSGMVLGLVYISFWNSKRFEICFSKLVSRSCSSISEFKFRRLGLPNRGFLTEGFANTDFKSRFTDFGMAFYRFLTALGL